MSYSRGGTRVLHDVSLTIEPGATALLGPSGSGKSTILRLLNRLADPDQGVVRMNGSDVRERDVLELRRHAVLVPQLPTPLPGTVRDNVGYGPGLIGRPVEAEPLLRRAGLDESYADREASQLSVGEQQRVMLARALALDPEVLLLDEPTSALDERARGEIEKTLLELIQPDRGADAPDRAAAAPDRPAAPDRAAAPPDRAAAAPDRIAAVSVVLVTHDAAQAERLTTRTVRIHDGRTER